MIARILVSALMAMTVLSTASARTVKEKGTTREQAEQACYGDATKLCGEFVPDEAKITACMTQKKAQLSPPCRKVFDEGIKD